MLKIISKLGLNIIGGAALNLELDYSVPMETFIYFSNNQSLIDELQNQNFENLDNFNKWLHPSFITKKIPVAVISRPGYISSFTNSNKVPKLGKRIKPSKSKVIFLKKKPIWIFIKQKLLAVSSSEIRRLQYLNNMDAKK